MQKLNKMMIQRISPAGEQPENIWRGLLLAIVTGIAALLLCALINSPIADSLIVALILGISLRSIIGEREIFRAGITLAPAIMIPIGIIFYGTRNLNFTVLGNVDNSMIALLLCIMIVYFSVIMILGKVLRQKKEITYLTASGSAICGASAIAVTSPSVKAKPDDVSIALLSVACAALLGFALIIPFVSALLDIPARDYSIMAGSLLQFTGLVKVATTFAPFLTEDISSSGMLDLSLSLKASRYLGLIIAIPLFASLIKKRFNMPWFLWAFVASGLLGTWLAEHNRDIFIHSLTPVLKSVHVTSWSIAMAAIGLNADVRMLLSNRGAKAVIMALSGFLAALATFFIGIAVIKIQ